MFIKQSQQTLRSQVSAYFLICGVTAIIAILAISWPQLSTDVRLLGYFAVAIALFGLVATSTLLRRRISSNVAIEHQLLQIADSANSGLSDINRIPEHDALSTSWNRMLNRLDAARSLETLEKRVGEAISQSACQGPLSILNILPDGIGVSSEDGSLMIMNNALRALLGVGSDVEATDLDIASLLDWKSADNAPEIAAKLSHTCRPVSFGLTRDFANLQAVLSVARYPLQEAGHDAQRHLWVVRDVTQQKLAEQMRTEFVQTVTHELRTPLTNIKAFAETLELTDDLDIEEHKEFCNIINSEATRLSRFIDELLDVSRMESGAMSLKFSETDLERLVNDVLEKVRPQLNQKDIEFETRIPPKLPKLTIDKDKVSAALVNLLGNAAKYTPDGGTVRFSIEQDSDQLQFQVEDSGIGISQDELPKLFDRFFRSEDGRVRAITGSGLGLTFVNEVSRLHGGSIEVESVLDNGSTFTMTLPNQQGA